MYQFSRLIYRELAPHVIEHAGRPGEGKQRFLRSCEAAVERLASDRFYFARPSRTLFNDVRDLFPMSSQLRAFQVIDRYMRLAGDYVEQHARAGVTFDGSPLCCHATTRKGTACQRVPLPGSKYCPSHRHLEESLEVTAVA